MVAQRALAVEMADEGFTARPRTSARHGLPVFLFLCMRARRSRGLPPINPARFKASGAKSMHRPGVAARGKRQGKLQPAAAFVGQGGQPMVAHRA